MVLNLIKKLFNVENLERVTDVIGFILGLEVVKKHAEEILAPVAKMKIKELHKKGNYREFMEAWSKLSEEEQEAVMELVSKMDNASQEHFIQQAALTGPTMQDTINLLKNLSTKDPEKVLEFLKNADYTQDPEVEKKPNPIIGDTAQASAAWENLINQINNDLT